MGEPGRLDPEQRREALARLAGEEFDVVVLGGGVTGCGCALDAATRGLHVALIEQHDYAAGTSSRSSRLIHGGLRYLEQRDLRLVREALRERALLLHRIAPHLVRPLRFVFPFHHRVFERAYIGTGVLLYDSLGGSRGLPRHRHLSRSAALRVVPALRPDALVGAIEYHDAQVDDARFTLALARTAAAHGAVVATRLRATGLVRRSGRVAGVEALDLETQSSFEVRGRAVIGAGGVWTQELAELSGAPARFQVRASKGVHLLVPRKKIRSDAALIHRTEKSVLFVLPWNRHWIIGTTDTDWDLGLGPPVANSSDIEYLLGHINRIFASPVGRGDVVGIYAGLRPLLSGTAGSTADLSRTHAVDRPAPGLTLIAGGKFTTYRVMAKDAVDAATEGWGAGPSRTAQTSLLGAEGEAILDDAPRAGLSGEQAEWLSRRYGSAAGEVLSLIGERRDLAEPLVEGTDYLKAEVVYAASHEGALHLDDVLVRRLRLSVETPDRGMAAAESAARLMASVLSWDEGAIEREVAAYRAGLEAELRAEQEPDDARAAAQLTQSFTNPC